MSKINKKYSVDVKGILNITDDGVMLVEVEDREEPLLLTDLCEDFNGKNVKISVAYGEEL